MLNFKAYYRINLILNTMMKSAIFSRSFLLASTFLFSIMVCIGQDGPSDQVVGTWTKVTNEQTFIFTMTSDLKYQVDFTGDEEADVLGSYVISGPQITFTDEAGEYSSGTSGVYEFKVDETSLKFSIVDDPVDGRSMLVEGLWSKAAKDK